VKRADILLQQRESLPGGLAQISIIKPLKVADLSAGVKLFVIHGQDEDRWVGSRQNRRRWGHSAHDERHFAPARMVVSVSVTRYGLDPMSCREAKFR
jgi:hypothetical protein